METEKAEALTHTPCVQTFVTGMCDPYRVACRVFPSSTPLAT